MLTAHRPLFHSCGTTCIVPPQTFELCIQIASRLSFSLFMLVVASLEHLSPMFSEMAKDQDQDVIAPFFDRGNHSG